MKNKFLLLGATAVLSMGVALKANATDLSSNQATLEMVASFIRPLTIVSDSYLGFGRILADEGGKKVVVTKAGALGENSTATMFSTGSFRNFGYDDEGNKSFIAYGSLNAGKLRAKGALNDTFDGEDMMSFLTEASINDLHRLSFDGAPIELKNGETVCGTVSEFDYNFSIDGDDIVANIGATLNTLDLRNAENSLICTGSTTVTWFMDPDAVAAAGNAYVSAREEAEATSEP